VDIRGLAGVLAGVLGKEPPNSRIWIVTGAAPLFVKSQSPQFSGGPVWEIEPVAPSDPKQNSEVSERP